MTQNRATPGFQDATPQPPQRFASTHYGVLGLHPAASVREIRQAYRELSKLYHPDTATLPRDVASLKFQQLNEAYATLSSPERRMAYDYKIGYSRVAVVQSLPNLRQPTPKTPVSSSAYLDPTDRPLSAGEIFALFILGLTFLACLILAIAIGLTRGESIMAATTTKPLENLTLPALTETPLPEAAASPASKPEVPKAEEPKAEQSKAEKFETEAPKAEQSETAEFSTLPEPAPQRVSQPLPLLPPSEAPSLQ